MGFVSGFTGGVTLTLAVAYYAVVVHDRNRKSQAVNLRTQTRTLNSLFEPILEPTRAEILRSERSTLLETAKDRWNAEVEKAVRAIQNANWEEIKASRDIAIARVLGDGSEAARHGIENAEKSVEASASVIAKKAEKAWSDGKDQAAAKTSQIAKEVPSKVEQLRTEASASTAGTVDAARGAVRAAVSRGIEKGKELVGKAQGAVGTATTRVESLVESKEVDTRSEVERALEERYKPTPASVLERTPEEILAERYAR